MIVSYFEVMKEYKRNFPFVVNEVEKFVKIYRYEQGANNSYIFNINKININRSGDINEYVIKKLNQNLSDLHLRIYGL